MDEEELDELVGLDELDELAGFEEELEDELEDELADDDELDDELVEELSDELEDVLSELLDFSEDELEVDELSVLLDFSEVLDELTELLGVSEGVEVFAPSLHAVKVRTIAAAETTLKILLLIFMPFFLSINKKSAQPKPRTEKCKAPIAATQLVIPKKAHEKELHFYRVKVCAVFWTIIQLCRSLIIAHYP